MAGVVVSSEVEYEDITINLVLGQTCWLPARVISPLILSTGWLADRIKDVIRLLAWGFP